MSEFYCDQEGREIVEACACARVLHRVDGDVVRRLQAALARVCREYTLRRAGMEHERALDEMGKKVEARAKVLSAELKGSREE